jgi:hypothetical protein
MTESVPLTCHPTTPTDGVRRLAARVARRGADALMIAWSLEAELARLRIPVPRPPRMAPRLWEHTCLEAFVAGAGQAYRELNVSPAREWAIHAFERYRVGGQLDDPALAPAIAVRRLAGRLEVEAVLPLARLAPGDPRSALRVGLAAVLEDSDGRLSYWALRHPAGRPDFHHADGFVLRLAPPPAAC